MSKLIKYIGANRSGPIGMSANPYPEDTQLWHILIDFACMPEREFTIDDAYKYHGLDKTWDDKSDPSTYYRDDLLTKLVEDKVIVIREVLSE